MIQNYSSCSLFPTLRKSVGQRLHSRNARSYFHQAIPTFTAPLNDV